MSRQQQIASLAGSERGSVGSDGWMNLGYNCFSKKFAGGFVTASVSWDSLKPRDEAGTVGYKVSVNGATLKARPANLEGAKKLAETYIKVSVKKVMEEMGL